MIATAPTLQTVLERTLDPEYGLIRYLSEIPVQNGEPELFIAVAEYANPLETPPRTSALRRPLYNRQASGAELNRESALWATVGEALERYAGMIYEPSQIIKARIESLRSGAYVSPLDFVLFSEDQYRQPGFPFSRFDPTSVIGWTLSQRLSDGAEVLLPASLVYMAYQVDQPHELFNDVYSTGLAIGPDPESAAATALRETIERDSFALHWATRTPPLCIPTERLIHLITPELARLLTTPGVDVSVGDMTTELGIPSLLVVVRPHHLPGIALGACSHPDPYVALRKAIIEAFHTFNWLVEMRRWPREVDAENLREFADHVRLYLSEGWVHKASFLWKDEELSPLFVIDKGPETLSAREQLRRMRRALMEHGHDAYFVSITPPDLADLGLAVIRAVAPTLQPLWAGSGKAGLDRRRIEPFLRAKGRDISQPINTDPHPFP